MTPALAQALWLGGVVLLCVGMLASCNFIWRDVLMAMLGKAYAPTFGIIAAIVAGLVLIWLVW